MALATPKLWNRIVVNYAESEDDIATSDATPLMQSGAGTPFLAMKKEMLRRSGKAPLVLVMMGTPSWGSNSFGPFYDDVYRLKELCIIFNSHAVDFFCSLPPGPYLLWKP